MSWRSSTVVLALVTTTAACAGGSDAQDAAEGTPGAGTAVVAGAPTPTAPPPAVTAGTTGPPDAPATVAEPAVSEVPAAATTPPGAGTAPAGVVPVGVATVPGRVTAADGSTCDVCLWLADTPGTRAQGLMGVTDLGGRDGMVFRWDEPTSGAFWMRDTPMALSIAFFAADGTFVSAADMAPCLPPTPDADCARYGAAGPYQYAVEVAVGGLALLLMGPGSRLDLLAGECPGSP